MDRLEEAAAAAEAADNTSAAASAAAEARRLLPLLEAHMLVHSAADAVADGGRQGPRPRAPPPQALLRRSGAAAAAAAAVPAPDGGDDGTDGTDGADAAEAEVEAKAQVAAFVGVYRRLLNELVAAEPALLDGSFAPMTQHPESLTFDNKRTYFRKRLRELAGDAPRHTLRMQVRRDHLFEDSFFKLKGVPAEELRAKLSVSFAGEPGIDAGGLLREWYQELAREIFNPGYALFTRNADGCFQPNKDSYINSHHLDFFQFCGKVLAKAVYDGACMDAHFTRSFYKMLLGRPVVWQDMEAFDPEYYKNLRWMLDNDIGDLELTFSTELSSFGVRRLVELKPGGAAIPVTEQSKAEYVQLLAELKMYGAIERQTNEFVSAFHALIPRELISIFNELELELLISGLPDIDLEDMRRNTQYTGYRADSRLIRDFWAVLEAYSQEQRALFLQFVTGSSKVPLEGFANLPGMGGPQKFHIHRVNETNRLPTAHTCFNQLDLPAYKTRQELEEKLSLAVQEAYCGFGFG